MSLLRFPSDEGVRRILDANTILGKKEITTVGGIGEGPGSVPGNRPLMRLLIVVDRPGNMLAENKLTKSWPHTERSYSLPAPWVGQGEHHQSQMLRPQLSLCKILLVSELSTGDSWVEHHFF